MKTYKKYIPLGILAAALVCASQTMAAEEKAQATTIAEAAEAGLPLDPYANETPEEYYQRMQWWREAKFGMFIHWGVYSVPAGVHKGEKYDNASEWLMGAARISVSEYRAYAKEFNPIKYDPEAWVLMAKEAGMKYIVITAKHHEGFALYDSKVTDWDIADASPYGKDLLKPLVAAAKKHGIRIGFYYSQAQDWVHPGGDKYGWDEYSGWDEAQWGDFDTYLKMIAIPQVRELLSNYDIDVLWWDTPREMTKERAAPFLPLLRLRPGIITNNRLGGGYRGDTETPEQHIPDTGYGGKGWETCMTMNTSWGYRRFDNDWKPTEELIRNLCVIVSKGGNYLLNVGPKPDGTFPQESVDRLKEVGQWMDLHGEAIYDAKASPVAHPEWGSVTRKDGDGFTTLYLHVFDWLKNGKITVPVTNAVRSVSCLSDPSRSVEAVKTADGIDIALPGDAPDPMVSVVKLVIEGETIPILPLNSAFQQEDGSLELPPIKVTIKGGSPESRPILRGKGDNMFIGKWQDAESWVEWTVKVTQPGAFKLQAQTASMADSSLTVRIRDRHGNAVGDELSREIPKTGAYIKFSPLEIGTISIPEKGIYTLSIHPNPPQWRPVSLKGAKLLPVE